MKEFWKRLPGYRRLAVLELYLVYFALGVAVILIGSILPSLREANNLSYSQSGNLLSIQSVGFLLIGLVTGAAVLKLGIHRAYVGTTAFLPIGLFMLVRGGPFPFLAAAMFLVGTAKGSITDYNNRVISDYAKGEAAPINSLHIFFAVGACLAPFLALFMTGISADRGWLYALTASAFLALFAVIISAFIKMDLTGAGPDIPDSEKQDPVSSSSDSSLAFFHDPLFLWTLLMGICDQALESSLMGWLTTYYLETGIVSEQISQLTTSLLWFAFLVGRILCMLLALKYRPDKMLLVMGSGTAVFMILLTVSMNAPLLFLSTIGLGLCLSGVYGTSVSNASAIFTQYSSAMGLFVTIAGVGGAAAPAMIGLLSDLFSVRIGFCVLAVVAVILTFSVIMNTRLARELKRV